MTITIDIRDSEKLNGEQSIFLSFPYNAAILGTMRTFPSRYWHADKKEWELPAKKLGEIKAILIGGGHSIMTHGEVKQEKKSAVKLPDGFQFKTKPFTHQMEGLEYGLQSDRFLLADEMGLGKTKQIIDIAVAKKLQRGYKHCLIICGVNGLKWNWQAEIATHSAEESWILGTRFKNFKPYIGSNSDKAIDLRNLPDSYFLITNIESMRDEEIQKELKLLCDNGTIGMIAFDESHKAKNPTSQQGKALLKLQAETMIPMTGTPLMNHPLDLFIILKWLGVEKHNLYQFKNHYCIMGGYGGHEITGYKNLSELQEQLNDIMLRRKKSEVLDLPDKIYQTEYVDMTTKQQKIYNEVREDIKRNIDLIKVSSQPLVQLIRLRQATGHTGILSSTVSESAKLDRLEELIEDCVADNKKVIVFSNWTQITDEIMRRLKKYRPALITGQTKDEDRKAEENRFQNDPKCMVIVGTIGAMGTGLTLTAATVEIFCDEPWNRANKEQAEDRAHRIGTTENITIITLICKDTIDARIHDLVYEKGAMADMLVDGVVNTARPDTIDFLLS